MDDITKQLMQWEWNRGYCRAQQDLLDYLRDKTGKVQIIDILKQHNTHKNHPGWQTILSNHSKQKGQAMNKTPSHIIQFPKAELALLKLEASLDRYDRSIKRRVKLIMRYYMASLVLASIAGATATLIIQQLLK